VRQCAERLDLSCIDLFMLHTPSDTVPIDESLAALTDEVNAGRIAAIGCSNFSGVQLGAALQAGRDGGYARFEAIENIYNLADPTAEQDIFPVCAEHEVAFITYSPMGAGFLTGKYSGDRDKLPAGTRFDVIPGHCDVYFNDRGFAAVDMLRARSAELGVSMATLAAAWAASSPHVTCTLFGARTIAHVDHGIAALAAEPELTLRSPAP